MSFADEFAHFMTECKTPYNFCDYARGVLTEAGYTEIFEGSFPSAFPDRGFWIRDGKTLMAFDIGGFSAGVVVGAHCDSPIMKLKPKFEDTKTNRARVANYAGGLSYSFLWLGLC